jgi:hypothetical protein
LSNQSVLICENIQTDLKHIISNDIIWQDMNKIMNNILKGNLDDSNIEYNNEIYLFFLQIDKINTFLIQNPTIFGYLFNRKVFTKNDYTVLTKFFKKNMEINNTVISIIDKIVPNNAISASNEPVFTSINFTTINKNFQFIPDIIKRDMMPVLYFMYPLNPNSPQNPNPMVVNQTIYFMVIAQIVYEINNLNCRSILNEIPPEKQKIIYLFLSKLKIYLNYLDSILNRILTEISKNNKEYTLKKFRTNMGSRLCHTGQRCPNND